MPITERLRDEQTAQSTHESTPSPAEGRPAVAGRLDALQQLADASPQVQRLDKLQDTADGSPRSSHKGDIHTIATRGVSGPSSPYPHFDAIQASFGGFDIRGLSAHTDASAKSAARSMKASAYAYGSRVAFSSSTPSLHEAAHEAAHFVQQSRGVDLPGGVGRAGDGYEQQAEQAALEVVAGRSAEAVLASPVGGSGSGGGESAGPSVQMRGEGQAIQDVLDMGIRRGNDASDVIASGGETYARQGYMNQLIYKLVNQDSQFADLVRQADASVTTGRALRTWANDNAPMIWSEISQEWQAGNCGEFAATVASRLIQTTTNQWVSQAAHAHPTETRDHSFVITSANQLPVGVLPLGYPLNRDQATVADAWAGNNVTSLRKFMAGDNEYEEVMAMNNIEIINSKQAVGTNAYDGMYPRALRDHIRAQARAYLQTWETSLDEDGVSAHDEQKAIGLSNARSARRDEDADTMWDIEPEHKLHVGHEDAVRLWQETSSITNAKHKRKQFKDWGTDPSARIDWTQTQDARAVFGYLVDMGSRSARREKAYTLVDQFVNADQALPAALTGAQLWKYVKDRGIRDHPTKMGNLVRNASNTQLQEMRNAMWTKNWRAYVVPNLSYPQMMHFRGTMNDGDRAWRNF